MTTEAQTESNESVDIDAVIRKVQKILSQTKQGSGTTEAEADNAMRRAQEMMAKYNLDLAQIEAAAGASNKPAVERVKEKVAGRAMYKWQTQLAKYVAEANFCYYITHARSEWVETYYKLDKEFINNQDLGPDGKALPRKITRDQYYDEFYGARAYYSRVHGRYQNTKAHIFVGRKNNVTTAQLMFQYLTQTIEDSLPITDNAQRLSRSAVSWREGCADRLCERLAKRRQDLIDKHDAMIKEEMAAVRADFERKQAEKAAKTPKGLPANEKLEVQAAVEGMGDEAYDLSHEKPEAEEQERPDVDESDTWTPGDGAEPEPEINPGTAMVLASVYDESEREANYEIAHGYEPGSIAKWRAEREERERQRAEEAAKATTEAVEAPVKQETERERRAREKREAEDYAKQRRRWAREDAAAARQAQREWERRDHRAYRQGVAKGNDIGIDTQIASEGHQPKKLG